MKNLVIRTMALALILGFALTACDDKSADEEYTVTYNADGGIPAIQKRVVTSGDSVGASNAPSDPSKNGYTFGGWYTARDGEGSQFTSSTTINADKTVYAKWTVVQYTVTFDLQGGNINGFSASQQRTVNSGVSLGANMPSDPSMSGYTFGGWYTVSGGGGSQFTYSTAISANITVYAKWTETRDLIQYTVTYNANGASGTTPASQTVTAGSSTTVAGQGSLTYSGRTFNGWNTNSAGTGTPYSAGIGLTVDANITLYAQWTTLTQYTVTYNANGASGTTPASQTVTAGSSTTVAGQGSLTYSGRTFNGWNTNSTGTGTPYSAGVDLTVNANITLYARWVSSSALSWEYVGDLPDWNIQPRHASVMNGKIVITCGDMAFTSSNGRDWSWSHVIQDKYSSSYHQHILFNNKLYSVGGFTYQSADDFWIVDSLATESSNLSSWTVKTDVTGLDDGIVSHVGLAFNNAMWVISGATDALLDDMLVTDNVWKSTNGVDWVKQNAIGLTPRAEAAGVVYNGKIYITGGYMDGGQDELNDVVVSSDGITWTTLTTSPGWKDRNGHTLAANSQGMWLIGGNGGDNSEFFNDVWFSSDGVNWTNKGNAPFTPRMGHASVIKDGYLYVIGGLSDDWETFLGDVWRVYIGGTDLDASSYYIEPAVLTISNNNSYPIRDIYMDGGSNELSSNLAVGDSWQKQFEPGTYSFTVYDTQDRYQSFSVTIGTSSQTKTIASSGWTEPIRVIPSYTLTIKNNYGYAISGIYVRKSGESAWGSNRISSGLAINGSVSLGSFESDTYEIKLISMKSIGGTGVSLGLSIARPGTTPSRPVTRYASAYYYPTIDLTADVTVTAPSASGSWSTTNR
ncbi:MAG: InlB B-repeat-containing protein [Treponema sp.]|jgi:uncharacterized repeat protein (TIGR02543 family)|nr:InlB B-repeat-containing protein [Treponema sp.]